jgi:hypothetical protein
MEVHRVEFVGAADDLEHPDFGFQVEAVSGFCLDGGGAVSQEGVEAVEGAAQKFFRARNPSGADGGVDSPALSGNIHVGLAAETAVELVLPRTGPHRVGVGIDEAWKHASAACLEGFCGATESLAVLDFAADKRDHTVIAAHHGMGVDFESGKVGPSSCAGPDWSDDLIGASDEEAHPWFSRPSCGLL